MNPLTALLLAVPLALAGSGSQEPSGLVLELTALKSGAHTVEALPLRARYVNTSGAELTLKSDLGLGGGLRIEIQGPGETAPRRAVTLLMAARADLPRKLKAGDEVLTSFFISPGLKKITEFAVPAAGPWTFKAVYEDSVRSVSSVPMTVNLAPSEGLHENVKALLGSKAWHEFVLNDGSVTRPDDAAPFLQFLASGGAAPQKDALAYLAGRHHQKGNLVEKTSETGAKYMATERNYPAALQAYAAAITQTQIAPLKERARLHLAECYEAGGQPDLAAGILKDVHLEDCDTDVRKRVRQLKESLGK